MKTAILLSGGWDSAACFLLNQDIEADLIFINYGQIYLENELRAAEAFSGFFKRDLRVVNLNLSHDQERRNFFFISEIKRLGYGHIIIGSRNLIPLFDRYRDSNWVSLKLFGYLMRIRVDLPITGWGKRKIITFVQKKYPKALYNCYQNKNDFRVCDCQNCREIRSLALR
jgi:7-cyano-7-deazaguanine synthase in queuosine biosynthesis